MDLDDESSVTHKNKRGCNEIIHGGDINGLTHCDNLHSHKSKTGVDFSLMERVGSGKDLLSNSSVPLVKTDDKLEKCEPGIETPAPIRKLNDENIEFTSDDENDFVGKNCSESEHVDFNDKIDYGQASSYWKKVPATVDGMLGGFAHISSTDINGSSSLIKWIFNQKEKPGHGRCVDCGAGIGRITQRLLQKHFGKVDMVEQSPEFIQKAKEIFASNSRIGEMYCMGLQDFAPSPDTYDVVWIQWVIGYLRDDDLVAFFRRMSESLKPNGVIVVKDNFTTGSDGSPAKTELDSEDSSVTRPVDLVMKFASDAGLKLIRSVQQRRFPKQLFKVHMLVYKPQRYSVKRVP